MKRAYRIDCARHPSPTDKASLIFTSTKEKKFKTELTEF